MANQTVTTTVNYDDASIDGLLNGEQISVNGGRLIIDADMRWNQQAAVIGALVISTTLGGSVFIDGTQVWEVPFSASTGNVPTQAALGGNEVTGGTSGATGELTRVWATGSLTPEAAGGAMPTTGYIKLRSKTGNFQSGETITLPGGATITASSAGRRSWIHCVGRGHTTPSTSGSRITANRLGLFETDGDWYEIGLTDGTDNQTLQYPVSDVCPAIWVETAASSGVFEKWLCAGNQWAVASTIETADKRGTYFGCTSGGVITLALRGSVNSGYKPPSGCRVRIPNILMSSADGVTPNYDLNILPANSLTNNGRFGFDFSFGGAIFKFASCNWLTAFSTNAYAVTAENSSFAARLTIVGTVPSVSLSNIAIGRVDIFNGEALTVNRCFAGATISDVYACRVNGNTQYTVGFRDAPVTVNKMRADGVGANQPGGATTLFNNANNSVVTDSAFVGWQTGVSIQNCTNLSVIDSLYASRLTGTVTFSGATNYATCSGSSKLLFSGCDWFENVANVQPYSALVNIGSGNDIEIRDIGTAAAPLNFGNNCSQIVAPQSNSTVVSKITLRKVYVENTRTSAFGSQTTIDGFDAYNVWSDTNDAQTNTSWNSIIRGGRFSLGTAAQSNVYGSHWADAWISTTQGHLLIMCNEPTAQSAGQVTTTLTDPTSGFTGSGALRMIALDEQCVWTMPYFALGVTGFVNVNPTIGATNSGNFAFTFQYDIGSGWNGTWLTLSGANLSALTVTPAIGVRLQIRAVVTTAASTNLLTFIRVTTTTDSVSQAIEYPLPGAIITVTGLVANSRVKLTRIDAGAVLASDSTPSNSITFDVPYSGAVRVEARNASSSPSYRPWVAETSIATGATTSVTALQEQD